MQDQVRLPEKVLVVDDDVAIANLIEKYLESMGIIDIDVVNDGQKAWSQLTDPSLNYEMVCLDWKLPGLSGSAILNRLRAHPRYSLFPVMIISGFISQLDFRLLCESPVCGLVEKPVASHDFQKKLKGIFQEYSWYHVNSDLISTILDSMPIDNDDSIAKLDNVIKNAPNPGPLTLIVARSLRERGHLDAAEKVLTHLLSYANDKLIPLAELGKVYLEKRDFARAIDSLSKAQALSPDNVNRLLMLGEANLEVGDYDAAQNNFEEAVSLDPTHEKANAGQEITLRIREHFMSDETKMASGLASTLNVIGIGMVHSKSFSKGINLYEQALIFLSNDDVKARVAFNAGLGFMKANNENKALEWLLKSRDLSNGKFLKAQKYIDIIQGGVEVEDIDLAAEGVELSEEEIAELSSGKPPNY